MYEYRYKMYSIGKSQRQKAGWWLPWAKGGENGEQLLNGHVVSFQGGFKTRQRWWLHNVVNALGTTQLFTLKSELFDM